MAKGSIPCPDSYETRLLVGCKEVRRQAQAAERRGRAQQGKGVNWTESHKSEPSLASSLLLCCPSATPSCAALRPPLLSQLLCPGLHPPAGAGGDQIPRHLFRGVRAAPRAHAAGEHIQMYAKCYLAALPGPKR